MATTLTTRPTTSTPPAIRPARRRRTAFWRRLPARILIALLVIVEGYPIVWLILGSFKSQNEFFSRPTWALPEHFGLRNYTEALQTANFAHNLLNSFVVVIPSLVLMITLGVAAAFALEVLVWKGRNAVLLTFVAGIMIPGQMILVPLFTAYFKLGLTSTLWPMIITYTVMGLPLTVFMMAAYFRAIPREIFEAATIDGAGMLRAFLTIALPMMKNAIVTMALVEFFSVWNDLLIAMTFSTDDSLATVQVGLLNFSDQYGSTQYGPLFAAISLNVIGMLILYLFLNRQIMNGLAAGSLKG